jgi:hypothetical protein
MSIGRITSSQASRAGYNLRYSVSDTKVRSDAGRTLANYRWQGGV